MFENAKYQDLIDKINRIRSYGLNRMLTIPQIAILGDQSSGKSSVLEAITKLSFPRNIETCTRFATQVNIRRSEKVEMSAYIDDEPEFNEQYQVREAEWNVHEIISNANIILCSEVEISEKVLEITISGPTLSPLTIIDLPGYINTTVDGQNKNIVETIRTINTRYIKDSRTIILAVVPANIDINNIFVLGEAERYDPSNERTIPIVTKPDTVESDLLQSLIDTLLNKRKSMRLGYLVMKNSAFKDIKKSWDEARQHEDNLFKSSELWNQVEDRRKGRVSVEKFLGELLCTHIEKELPLLKKEIRVLIGGYEKEIASMGPEVSNPQFGESQSNIEEQDYATDYKDGVDNDGDNDGDDIGNDDDYDFVPPPSKGDNHFIRSTLYRLYQRYNRSMNRGLHMLAPDKMSAVVLRYKGSELPGFISFTTFTQIYSETLGHWRERTKYYMDNIRKSRTEKAEKQIQSLLTKFQVSVTAAAIPFKLEDWQADYNERLALEDLQEMLLSYCKVARKRIVDVVLLQTIERHMFKQIELYFKMLSEVDESTISSRLLESPTKLARRQELQDKASVLRKSLRQL
ncbi:hypothetical protein BG000_010448 [Podila horticola]|nr:hypothetical protein BG000_010448 [Podila horticola]